jgi:hypothetical protein
MPKNDDEVGYKKPPKRHRFQKGRSGNPRGRAHGSQNFADLLLSALNRRVALIIDGKRTTMTMQDALLHQLVNRAAAGSLRHIQLLLRHDNLDAPELPVVWMYEEDKYL